MTCCLWTYLVVLAVFLSMSAASATDWFVRPGVFTTYGATNPIPTASVYGSQNGTSYANAWNGITSIVWGASGVNTGDTLYVCGTHIYKQLATEPVANESPRTYVNASGFTMRMDYPGDVGTVFGGATFPTATWTGPDADGVYFKSAGGTALFQTYTVEINGTNITRLPTLSSNALKTASSGVYLTSVTNYVKLLQGAPTASNIAKEWYGWSFHLNKQSNITFQACNFLASHGSYSGQGGIIFSKPTYAGFIGEKFITFTNCAFLVGSYFYPLPGQDNWTFSGCLFSNSITGVYSLIDGQTRGPWNYTITNCAFSNFNTAEYPDSDGHAVGVQGGCNWIVVVNTITNAGTAIAFWTGGNIMMTNNLIQGNFIRRARSAISEGGINATDLGARAGFRIINNVMVDIGNASTDAAIDSNNQDYSEILNNTIINANIGIKMEVVTNYVQGLIANNIIVGPTNYYFYLSGTRSNITYSHNLYSPTLNTTNDTKFCCGFGNDKGPSNVLANPLLAFTVPTTFNDARLLPGSPAINVGTNVGLIFNGSAPDLGAIEKYGGAALSGRATITGAGQF